LRIVAGVSSVQIDPMPVARFREVLAPEAWSEIEQTIVRARELLRGRTVWNVNSTAAGGGVAEMLRSLVGYSLDAGVDARWVVIAGDAPFFALTKRLHNHLHGAAGDGGPLGEEEHRLYEDTLRSAAEDLRSRVGPRDLVILHDPQTAGLVPALDSGVPVVWRSHIGRDVPNEYSDEAWRFLLPYVRQATGWIFSRWEYVPPGVDRERVTIVPPSIDPFATKNEDLTAQETAAIVAAAGLRRDGAAPGRPIFRRDDGTADEVRRRADFRGGDPPPAGARLVTQVSRWDALKDPLGVLRGFADHVATASDAHLVLAGPAVDAVADDPEGAAVLAEVEAARAALDEAIRARVHLAALPMDDAQENAAIVNALQRASAVVVQKSLAEGFGLTVAEAMWKGGAVVASSVGGIQDQIQDGKTGVLVDPLDLEAFGASVSELLADPHRAQRMGEAAQMEVRDHFLGARHLGQYVELLERVLGARAPG
jgi:trehalose synthase